jgi:hypothetical protein
VFPSQNAHKIVNTMCHISIFRSEDTSNGNTCHNFEKCVNIKLLLSITICYFLFEGINELHYYELYLISNQVNNCGVVKIFHFISHNLY